MIALTFFVLSLSLIVLLFLLRGLEETFHFAILSSIRRKLDNDILTGVERFEEMAPGESFDQLLRAMLRRIEHDGAVFMLFIVRLVERRLVLVISAIRGRRRIEKKESSDYIKTITDHKNGLSGPE